MTQATEYSKADLSSAANLMARMLPDLMNGVDFEQAGRAVLRRDQDIFERRQLDKEFRQATTDAIASDVYRSIRGKLKP